MREVCNKHLHISYFSNNAWGYRIWNAINDLMKRRSKELPKHLRNEVGDLMVAISIRVDCLPIIVHRINDGFKKVCEQVKIRNKNLDNSAYLLKDEIKYPLILDINSFLFEVYASLDIIENLCRKINNQIIRKPVRGEFLNQVLQKDGEFPGWYQKLTNWRDWFTHYNTPWVAVCLDREPKYELLVMKSNIENFSDSDKYFKLIEFNEIVGGFNIALMEIERMIEILASESK